MNAYPPFRFAAVRRLPVLSHERITPACLPHGVARTGAGLVEVAVRASVDGIELLTVDHVRHVQQTVLYRRGRDWLPWREVPCDTLGTFTTLVALAQHGLSLASTPGLYQLGGGVCVRIERATAQIGGAS